MKLELCLPKPFQDAGEEETHALGRSDLHMDPVQWSITPIDDCVEYSLPFYKMIDTLFEMGYWIVHDPDLPGATGFSTKPGYNTLEKWRLKYCDERKDPNHFVNYRLELTVCNFDAIHGVTKMATQQRAPFFRGVLIARSHDGSEIQKQRLTGGPGGILMELEVAPWPENWKKAWRRLKEKAGNNPLLRLLPEEPELKLVIGFSRNKYNHWVFTIKFPQLDAIHEVYYDFSPEVWFGLNHLEANIFGKKIGDYISFLQLPKVEGKAPGQVLLETWSRQVPYRSLELCARPYIMTFEEAFKMLMAAANITVP